MKPGDYTVGINKPIAEVWAYLSNLENLPNWLGGYVNGPQAHPAEPLRVGLGFPCEVTIKRGQAAEKITATVTEYNDSTVIGFDFPASNHISVVVALVARDSNDTNATITVNHNPAPAKSLIGRLLPPGPPSRIAQQFAKVLKARLES